MLTYNMVQYEVEESISLRKDENGFWIIKHEESGISTQGETRMEAMLMLVDAMSDVSYFSEDEPLVEELDEDPLRVASRVFVPSRKQEKEFKQLMEETDES